MNELHSTDSHLCDITEGYRGVCRSILRVMIGYPEFFIVAILAQYVNMFQLFILPSLILSALNKRFKFNKNKLKCCLGKCQKHKLNIFWFLTHLRRILENLIFRVEGLVCQECGSIYFTNSFCFHQQN